MAGRAVSLWVALTITGVGCTGNDAAGSTDGGTGPDGGSPDTGVVDGVPPPAPPGLPTMTPCPTGTTEEATPGGPTLCMPAEPTCDPWQTWFLGDTHCTTVGSGCPTGSFPDDVPGDAVYVMSGASGGSGSRAAPYGTIGAAVAAAPADGTIVVGPGTYSEVVTLGRNLTLRGACADRVTVTSTVAHATDGTINVVGGEVTLRDLTVSGSARVGIVVTGRRTTGHLSGLAVADVETAGIYVDLGSTADLSEIWVRDVDAQRSSGRYGDGIVVDTDATATLTRAVVERSTSSGVNVLGGASLAFRSVVIRDVRVEPATRHTGRGYVGGPGSTSTGQMLLVENVIDLGVSAHTEARIEVDRLWVSDTMPRPDGVGGQALLAGPSSALTVRRGILRNSHDSGLLAAQGAEALLSDVAIYDVEENGDGWAGRFVEVISGSSVTVSRAWLEGSRDVGLSVADEGTRLALEDVRVRDVRGASDGSMGRGINVQYRADLRGERVSVEDSRAVGLFVHEASATLSDLSIVRVTPAADTGRGRGINVQAASTLALTRGVVRGVFDVGLFVASVGSRATVRDLQVDDVTAEPCASPAECDRYPGAVGVGAYQDSVLELSGFSVSRARLCGIQLATGADLMPAGMGTVRGSLIGACLQVEGYGTDRLSGVRFIDNATPLDGTSLPVPSVESTFGGP